MSQRYIGGVVTETTNVAQSPWTGEWTQQAALQGFAGAQAPLKVANSLRFRSSASAYLSRTPSVAGNRQTWTWSGWVKRGILSTGNARLLWGGNSTTDGFALTWTSTDTLYVWNYAASTTTLALTSSAVFRDPSSWYHIVLSVDTTQATDVNRVRLYVNGVQYTFGTTTWCAQNTSLLFNAANQNTIGYSPPYGGYFDGYLAEVNFIDGQALPPTAFGTINKENGVWSPSAYTGTYGTNGFRLNFSNGTSTTTLGYDSSGNGNNWTTNNISLTAGSTYDWMIDSPTKFPGSSYGVGNYPTWNPLFADSAKMSVITDGNLSAYNTTSSSGWQNTRATMSIPASGKWYFEWTLAQSVSVGQGSMLTVGPVANPVIGSFGPLGTGFAGISISTQTSPADQRAITKVSGSSTTNYSGQLPSVGDVFMIAFDAASGNMWLGRNGTWFEGNPATGTTPSVSGIPIEEKAIFQGSYNYNGQYIITPINFGQRPFAYTPPSGYKSLCTQNLPGVTIQNGAQYIAATTYTGTGSSVAISNAVNGVGFQPDFVWVKARSVAYQNGLYDSVRGVNNLLSSNNTAAESTVASTVTAFASGGFSLGSNITFNQSGSTFVGWQWKAGGTAVTNTDGSITSSVSANTTSGFSVVTYTGNGVNGATVGHGLGIAPSMVIIKSRSISPSNWPVYHASIGNTGALLLDQTAATSTSVLWWNNTSPSSAVISLGTIAASNTNAATQVAYCFAAIPGYSAFGSYTGNGSADGPFVYCGFRPRFVMVKRTDAADSWGMFDSSRDAYNAENALLRAESSNAEASMTSLVGNPFGDFLSNGFKVRNSSTLDNASGGTYIYAAFAENPFQNALAR